MTTLTFGLASQAQPKNRITTRVITLWRVDVASLTTSVSAMHRLNETMFILKTIKSHFKGSYDNQDLTLVVILYEIYETSLHILKGHMIIRILHSWSFYMKFMKLAEGSFHNFHMK